MNRGYPERSVRQRVNDDDDFPDPAAVVPAPAAGAAVEKLADMDVDDPVVIQPMRTELKRKISQSTTPDQMIHIFKDLLQYGILEPGDANNKLKKSNELLLSEAVKINMTLKAGQVTPELNEIVNEMKQILIDGEHVTELKGGRRRSSSARKSSSRRGRRSAKKRGTQRKQKRRQRRGSRRAY